MTMRAAREGVRHATAASWAWIRAHPFTTGGLVSLLFLQLVGAGVLPLRQPWHAFMVPAYVLKLVIGIVAFGVLPFPYGSPLLAKVVYAAVVLPLYVGVLLAADALLVWTDSRRSRSGPRHA